MTQDDVTESREWEAFKEGYQVAQESWSGQRETDESAIRTAFEHWKCDHSFGEWEVSHSESAYFRECEQCGFFERKDTEATSDL